MQGASYSEIAQKYLSLSADQINNKRSKGDNHIPAVFGFIRKVVDQLAIDAGCFLAINEFAVYGEENSDTIPESLQSLPLCIRNGCHSLGTLSWFRFAFRQRVCAHALEQAFPLPIKLASDTDRAVWIRRMRRLWLSGEYDLEMYPLLNYAKTIVYEGGVIL